MALNCYSLKMSSSNVTVSINIIVEFSNSIIQKAQRSSTNSKSNKDRERANENLSKNY
jgi:hypothetical protein